MMVMDTGQIVREYRAAKHKRREITVLAQLNGCRESEILEVLKAGGVPSVEMPRKKRKPEPETMETAPETAEAAPETAAAAPEKAEAAPDVYAQIAAMIREAEAARQEALRQADAAEEQLRKIREQLEQLAAMSGGTSDV